MATEFLDQAERCFRQRAGARAERDALALLSRPRRANEERSGQGCGAVRARPGAAGRSRPEPRVARRNAPRRRARGRRGTAADESARPRAARGRRPLPAGPREARSPGLCGRREESRSRAGTAARLVEHSLPAGARLPRPRRHDARRSADAASRQRGRASGRSADAAGRWASAERRGSRSPRRRGPGETSVGRSRHVSTRGDPGGAGQRVHAAQPRHGAVRVRRRRGRPRSVSGRRQAVTRSGQGPLRRRHRHGGGGPRPRSHRGVLGFRQERSGRARSAA